MNPFHGRHFQGEIILWAVRWYCKYGISYRELQEMLAERGVNVDHTTIYRWGQRYANTLQYGSDREDIYSYAPQSWDNRSYPR